MAALPGSVLFCCDHNAVRSPMAEGLAKRLLGARVFIQSAGVRSEMEIDGFAVEVEYWPTPDPTGLVEGREAKLAACRQTRDQLAKRIRERFGG